MAGYTNQTPKRFALAALERAQTTIYTAPSGIVGDLITDIVVSNNTILDTPTAPSITSNISGSTAYKYAAVAVDYQGHDTLPGAWGTTSSGPSTLSPDLSSPGSALSLSTDSATTSALSATTYYVGYYINNLAGSTTTGSSEASIAVGTAGEDILTKITPPQGATSVSICVGTASGPLTLGTISSDGSTITYSGGATSGLAASVSSGVLSITISAAATSTGAASPSSNTATKVYNTITAPGNVYFAAAWTYLKNSVSAMIGHNQGASFEDTGSATSSYTPGNSNQTGTNATLSINVVPAGATIGGANRIVSDYPIQIGTPADLQLNVFLEPGDALVAQINSADGLDSAIDNQLSIAVQGVEFS